MLNKSYDASNLSEEKAIVQSRPFPFSKVKTKDRVFQEERIGLMEVNVYNDIFAGHVCCLVLESHIYGL